MPSHPSCPHLENIEINVEINVCRDQCWDQPPCKENASCWHSQWFCCGEAASFFFSFLHCLDQELTCIPHAGCSSARPKTSKWVTDKIWYMAKGHPKSRVGPYRFCSGGTLYKPSWGYRFGYRFRVGPYRFCSNGNPTTLSILLWSYLILSDTQIIFHWRLVIQ